MTGDSPAVNCEIQPLSHLKTGLTVHLLWTVLKCVVLSETWESCKAVAHCRLKRRFAFAHRGCQTQELGVVPMPLPAGVPYRARILCSFWRAGYPVGADGYLEEVPSEFHWLIEHWLIRNKKAIKLSQRRVLL